jgi:hypothetical protein
MIVPDIQGVDKGLKDAPMHAAALIRLERMARNMPILKLEMGYVSSNIGRIYLFWGEDGLGTHHGGWGIRIGDQDIGRTMEFKKGVTPDLLKQTLITDALGFAEMSYDRHMHDEGWWSSGRA